MNWPAVQRLFAMIYHICYYFCTTLQLTASLLWSVFRLCGAVCPWLLAASCAAWLAIKVAPQLRPRPRPTATMSRALARLLQPPRDTLYAQSALARARLTAAERAEQDLDTATLLEWSVASRGAALEAPPNSRAAVRMVSEGMRQGIAGFR